MQHKKLIDKIEYTVLSLLFVNAFTLFFVILAAIYFVSSGGTLCR